MLFAGNDQMHVEQPLQIDSAQQVVAHEGDEHRDHRHRKNRADDVVHVLADDGHP